MSYGLQLFNAQGLKTFDTDRKLLKYITSVSFAPNPTWQSINGNPPNGYTAGPIPYTGLTFSEDRSFDNYQYKQTYVWTMYSQYRRYSYSLAGLVSPGNTLFCTIFQRAPILYASGVGMPQYGGWWSYNYQYGGASSVSSFCKIEGTTLYIYIGGHGIAGRGAAYNVSDSTINIKIYEY